MKQAVNDIINDPKRKVARVFESKLAEVSKSSSEAAVNSIIQECFEDFEHQAIIKINYERQHDTPCTIIYTKSHSRRYNDVLESLKEYSHYCLEAIVQRLNKWQRQRWGDVERDMDAMKQALADKEPTTKERIRRALYKEAYITAINIVYTQTMATIMQNYHQNTLNDATIKSLMTNAKEYFKDEFSLNQSRWSTLFKKSGPNIQVYLKQREVLFEYWRQVIGALSEHRLQQVADFFLDEIERESISMSERAGVVRGLKYLRLHINTQEQINISTSVLGRITKLYKTKRRNGKRVKKAFVKSLTSILHPLGQIKIEDTSENLDYEAWLEVIENIYFKAISWAKKRNRCELGIPLAISVTCATDQENFLRRFRDVLSIAIQGYKHPNTKIKSLMCIQHLTDVYLNRHARHRERTKQNLEILKNDLLLATDSIFMEGATQDGLVALIITVAKKRLEFAITDLIIPLLEKDYHNTSACSEYSLVALRSLAAILERPHHHDLGQYKNSKKLLNSKSKRKSSINRDSFHMNPLEVLKKVIQGTELKNDFTNELIHKLEPTFSRLLAECRKKVGEQTVIAEKKLLEVNNDIAITVYRLCIMCMPIILPENMAHTDLITMLCESCLHIDAGVRNSCFYVLHYFMKKQPNIRATMINQMTLFITRLRESHDALIVNCLHHMQKLMQSWIDYVQHTLKRINKGWATVNLMNELNSYRDLCIHDIESTALLGLCSIHGTVRLASLDLLVKVKEIAIAIMDMEHGLEEARLPQNEKEDSKSSSNDNKSPKNEVNKSKWGNMVYTVDTLDNVCNELLLNKNTQNSALNRTRMFNLYAEDFLSIDINEIIDSENDDSNDDDDDDATNDGKIVERNHFYAEFEAKFDTEENIKYDNNEQYQKSYINGVLEETQWLRSVSTAKVFTKKRIINMNINNDEKIQVNYLLKKYSMLKKYISDTTLNGQETWTLFLAHFLRRCVDSNNKYSSLMEASRRAHSRLEPLFVEAQKYLEEQDKRPRIYNFVPFKLFKILCKPTNSLSIALRHFLEPHTLLLHCNYAVLTVITDLRRDQWVSLNDDNNNTNNDNDKKAQDKLIPMIKCNIPQLHDLAVTSLGNVHPEGMLSIMNELDRYLNEAHEYSNMKDKHYRTLRENYRVDVTRIYQLFAEGIDANALQKHPELAIKFHEFIVDSFEFLGLAGNELRWNLLELRQNFCVLVEKFAMATETFHDHPQWNPTNENQHYYLNRHLRRQLFELMQPWCGFGPSSAHYLEKVWRHKEYLVKGIKSSFNRQRIEEVFEAQDARLRITSIQAMGALLCGPCFDSQMVQEIQNTYKNEQTHRQMIYDGSDRNMNVFNWLDAILASEKESVKIASNQALDAFIRHNMNLLPAFVTRCYVNIDAPEIYVVARRYFLVLGNILKKKHTLPMELHVWLNLSLHKLTDNDLDVRTLAHQLIHLLERENHADMCIPYLPVQSIVGGSLTETFMKTQTTISKRLSEEFGHLSNEFIFEAATRMNMISNIQEKRMILTYMLPWIAQLHLIIPAHHHLSDPMPPEPIHSRHSISLTNENNNNIDEEDNIENNNGFKTMSSTRFSTISLARNTSMIEFQTNINQQQKSNIKQSPTMESEEIMSPLLSESTSTDLLHSDVSDMKHVDDENNEDNNYINSNEITTEYRVHFRMYSTLVEITRDFYATFPIEIEQLWSILVSVSSRSWPTSSIAHKETLAPPAKESIANWSRNVTKHDASSCEYDNEELYKATNLSMTINYLLDGMINENSGWVKRNKKLNSDYFQTAKRICVYLARSAPHATLRKLVYEIAHEKSNINYNNENEDFELSSAHFALIFLVEVALELDLTGPRINSLRQADDITMLFHVGTLCIDHPLKEVHQHAQKLLTNLIHSLAYGIATLQAMEVYHEQQKRIDYVIPEEVKNDSNIKLWVDKLRSTATRLMKYTKSHGVLDDPNLNNNIDNDDIIDDSSELELKLVQGLTKMFRIIQKLDDAVKRVQSLNNATITKPPISLLRSTSKVRVLPKNKDHFGTLPGSISSLDNLAPAPLRREISSIIVLCGGAANIQNKWANLSLDWATTTPNTRLAALSYRIFSVLKPQQDHTLFLKQIVNNWDKYILGEHTPLSWKVKIQLLIDIIKTLQVVLRRIENHSIENLGIIFWNCVRILQQYRPNGIYACQLSSELLTQLFKPLLNLLDSTLRRLVLIETKDNLGIEQLENIIMEIMPTQAIYPFNGIQPLVLDLLAHNHFPCQIEASIFISKLTTSNLNKLINSQDIDGDFVNLLATVPWLSLYAAYNYKKMRTTSLNKAVERQIRMLKQIKQDAIYKLYKHYHNGEWSTCMSFIKRMGPLIAKWMTPEMGAVRISILASLLNSGTQWDKCPTDTTLIITEDKDLEDTSDKTRYRFHRHILLLIQHILPNISWTKVYSGSQSHVELSNLFQQVSHLLHTPLRKPALNLLRLILQHTTNVINPPKKNKNDEIIAAARLLAAEKKKKKITPKPPAIVQREEKRIKKLNIPKPNTPASIESISNEIKNDRRGVPTQYNNNDNNIPKSPEIIKHHNRTTSALDISPPRSININNNNNNNNSDEKENDRRVSVGSVASRRQDNDEPILNMNINPSSSSSNNNNNNNKEKNNTKLPPSPNVILQNMINSNTFPGNISPPRRPKNLLHHRGRGYNETRSLPTFESDDDNNDEDIYTQVPRVASPRAKRKHHFGTTRPPFRADRNRLHNENDSKNVNTWNGPIPNVTTNVTGSISVQTILDQARHIRESVTKNEGNNNRHKFRNSLRESFSSRSPRPRSPPRH